MAKAGSFLCNGTILWRMGLLVWMLCQSRAVLAAPGLGLDTALNQAKQNDPLAEKDVFQTLSVSLKKSLLADANLDTQAKFKVLTGLESTTIIHVKLVGFPFEGERGRGTVEHQFARYIEAANQEARVGVIASDSSSHEFMVRAKITVDVNRANKALTDKIHSAIKGHFDGINSQKPKARGYGSPQVSAVPHTLVDDLIQEDFKVKLPDSYTVYLLNTKPQEADYAYEYTAANDKQYQTKCYGTFWAGKERYLWIDLSAGPVEYGPSSSGDGYVTGETFPMAKNYNDGQYKTAYLADLAAMVWSAARMLFVPSVRLPVPYERVTEVQIMHIQGANTTYDPSGIDVNLIEETLTDEALLLPQQRLKFNYFHLKFVDCPLCAAAIARAQRAFTSRVFMERYGAFVDEYLDSRELHEFLTRLGPDLAKQMNVPAGRLRARVLPVFVFDLDNERQLLLDHYHQVIPFEDMVIAVRSKASRAVTEYSCHGRPVTSLIRALERPVVGALLQTLWGVAPTHVTWSPPHNDSLVDYRWALGQTPFGPFSETITLSFAQRDAAPRNVLYSMLNRTITSAMELLNIVDEYGGEKVLFQVGDRRVEFSQRWGLFVYKLEKAVKGISHFDYNSALYFAKSADHDVLAMHQLAYGASSELTTTMVCYTDPPVPLWVWLVAVLFIAGCVGAYGWFRGRKLFVNKRKRF